VPRHALWALRRRVATNRSACTRSRTRVYDPRAEESGCRVTAAVTSYAASNRLKAMGRFAVARVTTGRRACFMEGGRPISSGWQSQSRRESLSSSRFDTRASLNHPTDVLILRRRLSVLLLALSLSASPLALCAGWMSTPEARMACCSKSATCPMHNPVSPGSFMTVSQADADSCCARSEQDSAASASASLLSFVVLPSVVPFVIARATTPPDTWRRFVPAPGTHLPRHLLLSVLLV
jgi:hypothetical protein